MAYQVLARKWRPQDFSQVVGQKPIVTALQNALTEGRIAQAYLFSGIRGVGKTSVARILAKALNCEQGPTATPCNECTSCTEITASSGTNLDVHEIDAATHSKVEQVRDLTEGLKYGPARDRYKVVILDEIHRLSRQAFDALLKIVEEPPAHLVFIFATTESEAVPVTILSRCQEFRFRRVPSQELVAHLRRLSDAEEIEVSDAALRLVARAGDGSVRDSVALLDQLATFGSGKIPDEDAARLLGGVDHAIFFRLLGAMIAGDSREVSSVVTDVADQGWDPRHVYTEFLNYGRDALHLALGGDAASVELPTEETKRLADLAKRAGYENLLRLVHQMLASENTVRRSEMGSLALEICWLRAAELPKLVRVEEILGGRTPDESGEAGPTTATEDPSGSGRLFGGREEGSAEIAAKVQAEKTPEPAPGPEPKPEPEAPLEVEPETTSAPTPSVAETAPVEEKPAEAELAETKPTETKPAETELAETKSAETKPAEAEPTETKPAEAKPAETREAEAKPTERGTATPIEPEGPPDDGAPPIGVEPAPESAVSQPPKAKPEPEVEPVTAAVSAHDNGLVGKFLDEVSRRKLPLAAHLREARTIALEGDVLRIYCVPGDPWLNMRSLGRPSNREALDAALLAVAGESATWRVVECDDEDLPAAPIKEPEVEPAVQDPRVQKVLDIFGGHVEPLDDPAADAAERKP